MGTVHRIDCPLSIPENKINPHNARTSRAQIRDLAESIKSFGFGSSVLIDERNSLLGSRGKADETDSR
jgi:ParB-like chromosome segregation protein Spo0J